ncbi:HTH-type transcriptional regulator ImmR [Lactobacillus parabuchneri] [Lactiplantibacillus mudanjiangensis]|nr:HTH-type transcriptional regulator ImmR [Lactobacillus parabuchneri] [Lactiplantibacillus mudanjiangensis]
MEIGQRIRQQRKLKQWSQAALGDRLHLSRQSISKWENGTALPSFANIVALSDLFGLSLDELIRPDEQLMAHLEDRELSPVATIWWWGLGGAILVFIGLLVFRIDAAALTSSLGLISAIGLGVALKWRQVNRAFSKAAIVWGSLLLGTFLVPQLFGMLATVITDMKIWGY